MTATTVAPAPAGAMSRTPWPRRPLGLLLLLVLLIAACLASIAVGTRSIGLGDVWRSLFDSGLAARKR